MYKHVYGKQPETGDYYAFDMDGTLLGTGTRVLPGRAAKLQEIVKNGGRIVIFSNQLRASDKTIEKSFVALHAMEVPFIGFAAREKNEYRKPGTKMLTLISEAPVIYVGDAAGRPDDFSDSDLVFARDGKVPFSTPEKFFWPAPTMTLTDHDVIMFVGPPACGKSTLAAKLAGFGKIINRDTMGGNAIKEFKKECSDEKMSRMIIDNTHGTRKARAEYLMHLAKLNAKVAVVLFTTQLDVCKARNAKREKPVKTIVYNVWRSRYEEPDLLAEGFTNIFRADTLEDLRPADHGLKVALVSATTDT